MQFTRTSDRVDGFFGALTIGATVGRGPPLSHCENGKSVHRSWVSEAARHARSCGQTVLVVVVRGTKKFLDRAGKVDAADERPSTTVLGDWYSTVWFWRPQVALFVNAGTLLPVLIPMAPATIIVQRFVAGMPETFGDYGLDPRFVQAEVEQMTEQRLAKTASRSVLGVERVRTHGGQLLAPGRRRRVPDLAAIFHFGVDRDYIVRSPCRRIRLPRGAHGEVHVVRRRRAGPPGEGDERGDLVGLHPKAPTLTAPTAGSECAAHATHRWRLADGCHSARGNVNGRSCGMDAGWNRRHSSCRRVPIP